MDRDGAYAEKLPSMAMLKLVFLSEGKEISMAWELVMSRTPNMVDNCGMDILNTIQYGPA
jgi:hypothetical protein